MSEPRTNGGASRTRAGMGGRLIGPHMPLADGLLKAANRADAIGATAIQIFTDNPTAWRRRTELPKTLERFRDRLREAGIGPLAIHAPYLINLCGGNEDFWQKSIGTVANELRVGRRYGAAFVVMHIGSHRGFGREEGIRRLVEGMRIALHEATTNSDTASEGAPNADESDQSFEPNHSVEPMLVLENAAGTGDGIGASVEDLSDILVASAAAGLPMDRLGVCLDTAHLWGAGYDISNDSGVERVVKRVDELIGRANVVMLHLNDSRTVVGSRLDRHEHIGAGHLGPDGMSALLSEPWLATLPTFLETPGMDTGYDDVNLDRVRRIIAGETLPELPPEAFEARGARTRTAPPTE